jgi:ribosome-binding ATPase YchF (GTP1/OBG family)
MQSDLLHFEDFAPGQKRALDGKEYAVQDGDVMHFRFNI